MTRGQYFFRLGILLLLLLAAAKGLFELGRIILLESHGPLDADSTIYFTLGRTMLNGFRLYVDFFDVQPPGIFLLTAASLLVTGDERLATAFVVWVLTALPVVIAFFAYREAQSASRSFRAILTLVALLLGIALTLYLEERAPTVETQLFGAFFGSLFAVVMIGYPDRWDGKRSVLCSVFLLASIGMKEPFLLTNLAAALLLARSRKHFLHAFAIPLGLAAVTGSAVLLAMGVFLPYVQSLGTTFLFRSDNTAKAFGPLFIRPLGVHAIFNNTSSMYPASPLFGYALWFLWSRFPSYRAPTINLRRLSPTLMLLAVFGSGALLMNGIYQLSLAWFAQRHHLDLYDPFLLQHALGGSFFALALFVPLSVWLYHRGMLRWLAYAYAVMGLTILAVGFSVYAGNHFAFAVPVYAALMLLFIQESAARGTLTPVFLVGNVLAMSTIFLFAPNPRHLSYLRHRMGYTRAAQQERIRRLDGIMDHCGWKQYYNEALLELAMARHSPFGPLVLRYDYMPTDHPLHVKTADNIVQNAQLVVAAENYEDPHPKPVDHRVVTVLREHIPKFFTKEPPPCAAPFVPIDGFTLWFRKSLPPKGS